MSEDSNDKTPDQLDKTPDQLVKPPDQIVGRTFADLVLHTQTGPKLDAALARLAGWSIERFEVGTERVRKLFRRTDKLLEESNVENPKAIPERVGIEVFENVAREDREELFELWARLMVGSARGREVDAYHVDTIKKLDPHSARVLIAIANELDVLPKAKPKEGKGKFTLIPDSALPEFMEALPQVCRLTPEQAGWAIARLLALGLIETGLLPAAGFMPYHLTGFGGQLLIILYPDGRKKPDGSTLLAFLEQSKQTSET
jgi:hypothetical protein